MSVWRRIAVVGSCGAGKSTYADRLADGLGAQRIELDALHFGPGWTFRPEAEVRAGIGAAVSAERWVACGNWAPIRDLVWGGATAVVWLDYPLRVSFARLLRRTLRRCRTGERVCNGNRESFVTQFASRDSLLLYALGNHAGRRRELEDAFADPAWNHLRLDRVASPTRADRLAEEVLASTRR